MLQRVISIANVGRFRNSASTPNPEFKRQSLVFAPNGYGKTTLCAIFRSLERGEAAPLLARRTLGAAEQPTINFLWNGAARQFRNGQWPAAEPRISIFDGVFVAENVHSGDVVDVANRRNLYRVIVGREGVELAAREAQLAEDGRAVQSQLGPAEKSIAAIAGGLTAQAFDQLPPDQDADEKLAGLRVRLGALREASAIRDRASLTAATIPLLPDGIAPLLNKSIEGVGADAEERVALHIRSHGLHDGGQGWLARGTHYAEGNDSCPFCGRDGLDGLDLVRAYRTLFGQAYASLRDAVARTHAAVDQVTGPAATHNLRTLEARNSGALDFWRRHCALPADGDAVSLDIVAGELERAHGLLTGLLNAKAARLLEPGDAGDLEEATAIVDNVRASLQRYNATVDATNRVIAARKAEVAGGDSAAVQQAIQSLEVVQKRHSAEGIALADTWRRLDGEKRRINGEKGRIRTALEDHCKQVVQPYEERINAYLATFNAGFTIASVGHAYPGGVATSSYVLKIGNVAVPLGDGKTPEDQPAFKNTLSAGDRTTLALAFFLADLQRIPDVSDRVVVFDDPFNSQDAFRRRQTIYEIMAVAKRGAQIIVLSHDPVFLKSLWEKCPQAERAALQVNYHASTGSKIMPFDLETACRGRAAAELDDLLAFRANGAGNPREIIKKLRIVLETHFRCTFTGAFGPDDNLGEIIRKTREGGQTHPAFGQLDALERINDYTADYHHGEDARGEPEPAIDAQELLGFVNQTLQLANAMPA